MPLTFEKPQFNFTLKFITQVYFFSVLERLVSELQSMLSDLNDLSKSLIAYIQIIMVKVQYLKN